MPYQRRPMCPSWMCPRACPRHMHHRCTCSFHLHCLLRTAVRLRLATGSAFSGSGCTCIPAALLRPALLAWRHSCGIQLPILLYTATVVPSPASDLRLFFNVPRGSGRRPGGPSTCRVGASCACIIRAGHYLDAVTALAAFAMPRQEFDTLSH